MSGCWNGCTKSRTMTTSSLTMKFLPGLKRLMCAATWPLTDSCMLGKSSRLAPQCFRSLCTWTLLATSTLGSTASLRTFGGLTFFCRMCFRLALTTTWQPWLIGGKILLRRGNGSLSEPGDAIFCKKLWWLTSTTCTANVSLFYAKQEQLSPLIPEILLLESLTLNAPAAPELSVRHKDLPPTNGLPTAFMQPSSPMSLAPRALHAYGISGHPID